MRIAIVGAGIAGLAAARTLTSSGAEAVVFEKSRGVGGRVATRRADGFIWDTGATSLAPRGRAIEAVPMPEAIPLELPVWLHDGHRAHSGDPRRALVRTTFAAGINRLAKTLAEGLDLRFETSITEIEPDLGLRGERFDGIILTAPIPQSCALLWSVGESRPVAHSRYRACLSVLLGWKGKVLPDTPYFALLDSSGANPVQWISLESRKAPGRAPEGGAAIVVQMSENYSLQHYRTPDQAVVADALHLLERLYGLGTPDVVDVKRWKYSQPTGLVSFERANPPGVRILLAGDGVSGPRIEDAYDSGVQAAQRLLGA